MMIVEEARLRFSTYTRFRGEPTADEWQTARAELLSFIKRFFSNKSIDPLIYDARFHIGPTTNRNGDKPSSFMQQFISNKGGQATITEALMAFETYLRETVISSAPIQRGLEFNDLERIVPRQQVAPVQFDVVNDRIVVAVRSPQTAEVDRANIQSALEHIRDNGQKLINNLERSNCDKRLLDGVKELQSQLLADGNIVKIGLTNMACSVMSVQFQSELPDAVIAIFNAHSASISLYVAQFPEWEQFTQKATAIDLDEEDIADVDVAAGEVIAALSEHAALVDPDVPRTIAYVRQFLAFPGTTAKRAAFAVIRTIENLVSSILRHSMNFLTKTAEKTVEQGSTTASVVIIGLLGLALTSALGIAPAAGRVGAPWVKQAADIVQKQIDKVTE